MSDDAIHDLVPRLKVNIVLQRTVVRAQADGHSPVRRRSGLKRRKSVSDARLHGPLDKKPGLYIDRLGHLNTSERGLRNIALSNVKKTRMGDSLTNLGTCKAQRIYANELWSDGGLAAKKNVLIVGHTDIDLLPNKENGSTIAAVSQAFKASHRVNVHGDLAIRSGDLVCNGIVTTEGTGLTVAPTAGAVRVAGHTNIDFVPNRANGSDAGSISQVDKASHRVNVYGDLAAHDRLIASDIASSSKLRLSGSPDVAIDSDLVVTATGGGKGVIKTAAGDLELRPDSGTVKVVGNVEIAGLVSSVAINSITNEIADKTLSLANPASVLVAHWPFDGNSGVDVAGSSVVLTNNGGVIENGQWKTALGSGTASATHASFPSSTSSFDVSLNVSFVGGLPADGSDILSYGDPVDANSSYTLTFATSAGFVLSGGGVDPLIGAFLFAPDTTYAFRVAREYDLVDPYLSTVKVYVNNAVRASATGLASQAVTALPPQSTLTLGDVEGIGSGHEMVVDNLKIRIPTAPTNAFANGAGVRVAGDGKVDSVPAPRAISWNAGMAQEAGDHTGSYWHFEGGQLAFSRIIRASARKAPGTDVLLSSLPNSAAETHHYPLATTAARVGVPTFVVVTGGGEFDAVNGVWKSKFDTATGASYLSASDASMKHRASGNYALGTVTIRPQSSLAACTGTGYPFARDTAGEAIAADATATLELFTVGDAANAGEYVRVWAFKSGALLVSNGVVYAETPTPVVSSREFQLGVGVGVHGVSGAVHLYVNGVAQTLTATKRVDDALTTGQSWGVTMGETSDIVITVGSTTHGNGEKPVDVWYKNLRLIDTLHASFDAVLGGSVRVAQISNAQLYRYADEYDGAPIAVSYSFRIADDEGLQIAKTRGSASTLTLLGNPVPHGSVHSNTLGAISDAAADLVAEMWNY